MFRKIHSLKITLFTVLLTTFAFQANYAQVPGSVDTSFNSSDINLYNGVLNVNDTYRVVSVASQNDGKTIVGTTFRNYNGEQVPQYLIRLNVDGTIDSTFSANVNSLVNVIVIQPDGKILIGGAFTSCDGVSRNRIARLNSDGSLDLSFDPGIGFNLNASSGAIGVGTIVIQSDGKLLVGGSFNTFNGINRYGIARLNSNGSLDLTFEVGQQYGFSYDNGVKIIVCQPDGKILIKGDNPYSYGLLRFNNYGIIDNSFNCILTNVSSIILLSDGKILSNGNDGYNKNLYRLNSNGSIDNTLVLTFPNPVGNLIKQSDNKIVYLSEGKIRRLNVDLTEDNNYFINTNKVSTESVDALNSLTLDVNDKVIAYGEVDLIYHPYSNIVRATIMKFDIDGNLNESFNPVTGLNTGYSNKSIVQPDGKVLICGTYDLNVYNRKKVNGVFRINADGSLDETFRTKITKTNGVFTNADVYDMILQPDGKVIIRGDFEYIDNIPRNSIARLNSNGSLDTSFNPGTGINLNSGSPEGGLIALQQDGKIIIPAFGNSYNGVVKNGVIRLNSDGSIDNTYNDQTYIWQASLSGNARIHMQPDQKIIIAGKIRSVNGVTRYGMARLNIDGTLDTSFNTGTGFFDPTYNEVTIGSPNIIRFQSNNKIIFGGNLRYLTATSLSWVGRLNTDGTNDTTFSSIAALGSEPSVFDIAVQSDDKLLIGLASAISIRRLDSNGSADTSFYTGSCTAYTDYNGNNLTGSVKTISLKSDGKIVVTGGFETFNGIFRKNIVQLYGGNLTTSPPVFNTSNSNANGEILTMAKYSDNKVILGGKFETYNFQSARKITKINNNGSKDIAFNSGTGFGTGFVNVKSTAIQQDGKLIVVGDFVVYNGVTIKNITRLNQDGTIDSSFNTGSGANALINSVAIQQDGKIIIAGNFSSYNGTSRNKIARLNNDGTIDVSFNIGTGFDTSVSCVAIQNDGKILVGGIFDSYNGQSAYKLARLNPDGSFDSSFVVSFSISSTTSLAIQQDGKIITGGYYNGTTPVTNYLKRLNINGSIDTTFNQTVNGQTKSIVFQPDGKILIGGDFTIVENTGRNRFARLYQNGKLDRTLDIGLGANAAVNSIVVKNDGGILIAGAFTSFNGYTANYITEIQSGLLNTVSNYFEDITLYPNPVNDILNIDLPDYSEIREVNVFDLTGKRVLFENKVFTTIDFSNLSSGLYLFQIKTSDKSLVRKIVKQ